MSRRNRRDSHRLLRATLLRTAGSLTANRSAGEACHEVIPFASFLVRLVGSLLGGRHFEKVLRQNFVTKLLPTSGDSNLVLTTC